MGSPRQNRSVAVSAEQLGDRLDIVGDDVTVGTDDVTVGTQFYIVYDPYFIR